MCVSGKVGVEGTERIAEIVRTHVRLNGTDGRVAQVLRIVNVVWPVFQKNVGQRHDAVARLAAGHELVAKDFAKHVIRKVART